MNRNERMVVAPILSAVLALSAAACSDGESTLSTRPGQRPATVRDIGRIQDQIDDLSDQIEQMATTTVATTTTTEAVEQDEPTTTEASTTTLAPTTTEATTTTQVQEFNSILGNLEVGNFEEFRAEGSLDYPSLVYPDPSREPVFPDVPKGDRPALVAYETPYEDGDYFEDSHGDIDVPQYNYRVITAGRIKIPQLGIDCQATREKGCAVILINHFGDTVMFRDAESDNGFTITGRIFDMSTPDKVTTTGQALLDHYMGRMTESEDGANCSTIDACQSVEYYVAVVGGGQLQSLTGGIYSR